MLDGCLWTIGRLVLEAAESCCALRFPELTLVP